MIQRACARGFDDIGLRERLAGVGTTVAVKAGGGTLTLGQAAGASVAANVGLAALPGIAKGSFDVGPTVGGRLVTPGLGDAA